MPRTAVSVVSDPWHLGMMLAADTETTGVNPVTDRLVTACAAYVDGSGKQPPQVRNWLAWPEVEIPESAAKIHGITTEHARENGFPAVQVIGEAAEMIISAAGSGIPLVLYNAAYDLTLLDRETRRYGFDPFGDELDAAHALVVDPLVLDKALDKYRKGSRKLVDVAAHYGVRLDGAHSADGDALAAARVAWKIAARHPQVARMSRSELMAFQATAAADQAKSLREHLAAKGETKRAMQVDGAWPWRTLAAEAVSR